MAKGKHPPEDWLYPKIWEYFAQHGHGDREMAKAILADIDKEESFRGKNYTMSESGSYRIRKTLGLKGTRQQKKEPGAYDNVPQIITKLRPAYPNMGARSLVVLLRWDHGVKIPEKDVADILKQMEPEKVAARYGHRFKRSRFYSAGVMEILSFDQHDKWKYYGLYLHLGMDPYTGRLHWNKIWWTNRNTALVTSYYLGAVRRQNTMPLLTFSDTGRENNGIAKCHSTMRQRLDPSLRGTIQHKWFYDKMNIKSEISWGRLRRGWATGFEMLLDQGEIHGIIDFPRRDPIETFLFRWLFVPYLQNELDVWTKRQNGSMRRAYKHKILPHGIPDEIHENPGKFRGQSFAVHVDNNLLDEMEALWAPPDNPVFELTSRSFHARVQQLYTDIGCPTIEYASIWNVFEELKDRLERELQDGDREAVATEFRTLEQNFEQDADLVDVALPGENSEDDPFFDDRLFSDDEQDDIDDDEAEYEIELTEDEDASDEDEVEDYLTQQRT
ncbi:hypothetical protein B0H14DRAFT_3894610 [Mycena olivaceomarginata]|nr:hypothetical protein B0H14DRAFT_3894610 [Mycena olivaceomarginata]